MTGRARCPADADRKRTLLAEHANMPRALDIEDAAVV